MQTAGFCRTDKSLSSTQCASESAAAMHIIEPSRTAEADLLTCSFTQLIFSFCFVFSKVTETPEMSLIQFHSHVAPAM